MPNRINRKAYLKTLSTVALSLLVHDAMADDKTNTPKKDLANKPAECSSSISEDKNKVEFINCKDIKLDLTTKNGAKISIDGTGESNSIKIITSSPGSTTVKQDGNNNTIVVTQSGDSKVKPIDQDRIRLLQRKRDHEMRIMKRRLELLHRKRI